MTLQIYGSFRSRTRRVLWAALELGLDFDHVSYAPHDPLLKRPEFLIVNPLGRIPAIRDGELCLAESLAINLHIAKHYDHSGDRCLYAEADEALIWQWTLFAASDLDPWVVLFGEHTAWLALADRVTAFAQLGRHSLDRSLHHLENALASKPFLVGDAFSIADLNAASVLQSLVPLGYPYRDYPHVNVWLHTALARPAALAAKEYP